MCGCTVNVSEKLQSLDEFEEKMKLLSQHSDETVRAKAVELTQITLAHTTHNT